MSASFKIDKGQAQTTDLNLVGPLVKMTGAGTIDLGTKQIGFRVEPKLVMTTEGQGRASDPVGLGIPVMIEGPWGAPRIYPEMQGILDNPDAAYAKLKEMGKGLFGENGAGLGAAIGSLLGGTARRRRWTAGADRRTGRSPARRSARWPARRDHRQSAAAGLERLGPELRARAARHRAASAQASRAAPRPPRRRTQVAPAEDAPAAEPAPPRRRAKRAAQQDSQPMNDVLRQLSQPLRPSLSPSRHHAGRVSSTSPA